MVVHAVKKVSACNGSPNLVTFFTMLMKRQFVVTHTVRQTEIAAFLGIWVADTPFVKMLCPQKKKLLVHIL